MSQTALIDALKVVNTHCAAGLTPDNYATELGTAVYQNTDTAGQYGIGVVGNPFTGNIDTGITKGGFYTITSSATGTKLSSSAMLIHISYSAGFMGQIWIDYSSTVEGAFIALREYSGGAWGSWRYQWGVGNDGNGGRPPAPKPTTADTIGRWQAVVAGILGGALSLPAGGTWAYMAFYYSGTNYTLAFQNGNGGVSIAAGGTQVCPAQAGFVPYALGWRIA